MGFVGVKKPSAVKKQGIFGMGCWIIFGFFILVDSIPVWILFNLKINQFTLRDDKENVKILFSGGILEERGVNKRFFKKWVQV